MGLFDFLKRPRKNTGAEQTVGSATAKVNGKTVPTGVKPVIREDRIYMPIQFLADSLGVKYSYDSVKKVAVIS